MRGSIKEPETATSGKTPVHVFFEKVPNALTSRSRHTRWTFLTSIHVDEDRARSAYTLGMFSSLYFTYQLADYSAMLGSPIMH